MVLKSFFFWIFNGLERHELLHCPALLAVFFAFFKKFCAAFFLFLGSAADASPIISIDIRHLSL